ncbi:MAG: CbiX/SirB N-terminal domain-containing protein [SAR324 cluster bacterium]|nr:CbiX/SirB N-terminal domain-containing protein [SAR324 cluster bacterium]
MKALLVVAHGSRREQANEEFTAFVQNIGEKTREYYHFVGTAFLEICHPSLVDAARALMAKGVTHIHVYPYFLNTGKHVDVDIPAIIKGLKESTPDCHITMLEYFGKSNGIVNFALQHLRSQDVWH